MYHRTRVRRLLAKLLPYGKMSLSNYIGQSVVGGFVFYHWGLGLYTVSGHTMSLVLGVAFVFLQYTFCRLWLRNHKRGPLEQLLAQRHVGRSTQAEEVTSRLETHCLWTP